MAKAESWVPGATHSIIRYRSREGSLGIAEKSRVGVTPSAALKGFKTLVSPGKADIPPE
jgi:hypothetical protein